MGQAGLEHGEAGFGASGAGALRLPQPSKGSPCRPQSAQGKPACPECGSQCIYKDGLRRLADGSTRQRYLCRDCGHRFSQNDTQVTKMLSAPRPINDDCRVRAPEGGVENSAGTVLVPMEEKVYAEGRAAGATEDVNAPLHNEEKIFKYAWILKKEGYSEATIESRVRILRRLVKLGANLSNPESVKEVVARQNWSNGRKELAVEAYSSFLKVLGGTWTPPRYKREESLPWIPTEREIDQLIAGVSRRYAAYLQLIKETGMRAREAFNLRWDQVDLETRTLRVIPEKGSNPRIFNISSKLAAMLSSLPRKGDRVFGNCDYRDFSNNLRRQRNRVAEKLKNPRIKRITPLSIRHWKGTWEYHRTKDILHVMRILGHKNIKNTLIYVQIEQATFKGEKEYVCKAARTVNEAKELIESGFEYVCEIDGTKLFRKPK